MITRLRSSESLSFLACSIFVSQFYRSETSLDKANDNDDDTYLIAQRFRVGLQRSNLRLRKSYGNGMKSYAVRTRDGLVFGKDGLPICRVARVEIDAKIDELIMLIEDPTTRKEWDSKYCSESRMIKSNAAPSANPNYYWMGRPGWIVPARDLVFSTHRLSPAIMGINNFQSIVILNKDESSKMPQSWKAVRAKSNSCFVIEPLSPSRCLLTYMVELSPGGYAGLLDNASVDFFTGDCIIQFLHSLKSHLEEKDKASEMMSIEEAARLRFQQKQKKESSSSIMDELNTEGVSAQDLKATISLLERKLSDVRRQEIQEKLDLSGLKKKIQDDLITAKDKLRRAR